MHVWSSEAFWVRFGVQQNIPVLGHCHEMYGEKMVQDSQLSPARASGDRWSPKMIFYGNDQSNTKLVSPKKDTLQVILDYNVFCQLLLAPRILSLSNNRPSAHMFLFPLGGHRSKIST